MVAATVLHVVLAISPSRALPPAAIQAAVLEARGIWAPYGVDVARGLPGPRGWTPDGVIPLGVVEARLAPGPAAGWSAPLGAITFDAGGVPGRVISVYTSDLLRFVEQARVLGAGPEQWPEALREAIVGRALGRVLAHEIGHYLLHSPHHASHGLMRAVQRPDDLTDPARRAFTLSGDEADRLIVGKGGNQEEGPAHAAGPWGS